MRYWLMKSEPDVFGIDDLAAAPRKTTAWWGVRNYQARNFMRDDMQRGDLAFFYHSSCPEPGIAGIARVSRQAYPDATQFNPKSEYFDPAATPDNPRWVNVDVTLVRKTRLVSIQELRSHPQLAGMRILQRGNRLSITPVEPGEWGFIIALL
jgi:predicted RNA-binding protein with PUA-like domain